MAVYGRAGPTLPGTLLRPLRVCPGWAWPVLSATGAVLVGSQQENGFVLGCRAASVMGTRMQLSESKMTEADEASLNHAISAIKGACLVRTSELKDGGT